MSRNDDVITVCGAGTLGANLAENLARLQVGRLRVIDRDRVERRNLANQPFSTQHVGQPKTKALSELLFRAVGATVATVQQSLSAGNAAKLLAGSALVIDCFDNTVARAAVQRGCREAGIPCLHAGLSPSGYGEVIWDERYRVPEARGEDACEQPLVRTLSLLVVAMVTQSVLGWREDGARADYSVTLADLRIERLHLQPVAALPGARRAG